MRKILLHILVCLLLAVQVAAQGNQPLLVDEFGIMPLDELMARIDALAVGMEKMPNSKALVRISGGQGKIFAAPYGRGSLIKSHWNNNRKFPSERLLIQFCGINKEPLWNRFYIVRENDKVEPCEENLIVPKETLVFGGIRFYSPEFKLVPLEVSSIGVEDSSDGEYSMYAQNVLKRLMDNSSESKIYVIGYLSKSGWNGDWNGEMTGKYRRDKKSYAGKMLLAARNELIKNGFSASQIVTVDGGYVNDSERRLEFWFVPKGGAIPKPKPDYVPKKSK